MKTLRHWLIARFYPGTLEEFYAAREIQSREFKVYCRQFQFILGAVCFLLPMFFLLLLSSLPFGYKALLFLSVYGVACLRETISEHYSLQLLRRDRKEATKT